MLAKKNYHGDTEFTKFSYDFLGVLRASVVRGKLRACNNTQQGDYLAEEALSKGKRVVIDD